MEPDHLAKRYRRKRSPNNVTEIENVHSRSKRAIPHIIYPEILVIVDYDGYRLHGGDNVQVTFEKKNSHSQTQTHIFIFKSLTVSGQTIFCCLLEWCRFEV